MNKVLLTLLFLVSIFIPTNAHAAGQLPSISVINQIRGPQLGLEKADLLTSLKGQFTITKKYDVRATWLWQYSALEDSKLTSYAREEMTDQEMGIFLEIDRNFAEKSGVLYRGQGPWYFSDGLFLFSYDQSERKKYIDVVFAKFHDTFGYYPKSVGAWWIDAWSLSYMHDKYGVTSSLRAADQLDLDVYSIWGTPWSISYLASQTNAGIPAQSIEKSSGILMLQWASRDPLLGYASSPSASLYSLQDYFHFKENDYFTDLLKTYLNGPTKNAVIGLEGGYAPISYEGMYERHLRVATDLVKKREAEIIPAREFADRYFKAEYKDGTYILRRDPETGDQAFWYQSSRFRIGIKKTGTQLSITDIRDYTKMNSEEFYLSPNTQGYLRIDESSILDSSRFSQEQKVILEDAKELHVKDEKGKISFFSGDKKVVEIDSQSYKILGTNQIDGLSLQKTFGYSRFSIWIELFIVIVIIYSALTLYLVRKNKSKFFITLSLFLPLLFFIYYLQYALKDIDLFIFDTKMMLLSPLFLLPFSISTNIIVGFFLIPFSVLLVLHYFLIVRKDKKSVQIFTLIILGFTFIYLKLPYFPLNKNTAVVAGLGILFVVLVKVIYLFRQRRDFGKMRYELFIITIFAILMGISVIFSRQQYILSEFEIHALERIKIQNNPVIFLSSSFVPIYKSSAPLLWKYPIVAQLLTQRRWEHRTDFISASDGGHQELVFVPRYLGSDIDARGIGEHLFKSIFDNSNIVIYKK